MVCNSHLLAGILDYYFFDQIIEIKTTLNPTVMKIMSRPCCPIFLIFTNLKNPISFEMKICLKASSLHVDYPFEPLIRHWKCQNSLQARLLSYSTKPRNFADLFEYFDL